MNDPEFSLMPENIEDFKTKFLIEPTQRELSFIAERRFITRQIEQVFRIPASFLSEVRAQEAMIEGRIETKIEAKISLRVTGRS